MFKNFNARRTGALIATAATGFIVSATASAGELADAISTELTTGKAEIMLVGAAVLTLTGVVLLIAYVRRSAK